MSVIFVKGLIVEGNHGVEPEERSKKQRFLIDIELRCDTTKAGYSDDVADTVSWSEVRRIVVDIVQKSSYKLMEKLAEKIADDLLIDMRITWLQVSIEKPDAFASGVPGIRIERSNEPK